MKYVVRAFLSFTRENTLPRILSFLSSTRMFVTAYIKWRKMLNVEQVEKNEISFFVIFAM